MSGRKTQKSQTPSIIPLFHVQRDNKLKSSNPMHHPLPPRRCRRRPLLSTLSFIHDVVHPNNSYMKNPFFFSSDCSSFLLLSY